MRVLFVAALLILAQAIEQSSEPVSDSTVTVATNAPETTTQLITTQVTTETTQAAVTTLQPTITTLRPTVTVEPTVTIEPTVTTLTNDYRVCRADAEQFCPSELASHDRSSLCDCMKRHMDELSPACSAFVLAKKAEREAAAQACRGDVAAFCPEAFQQGRWELRRCMMKHYNELSTNCSEYIRKKMDDISPDACDNDATNLCSSAVGFSATLSCLKEHMKTISPECVRLLFKPSPNATNEWGRWGPKGGDHDDNRRHHEEGWKHGDRHQGEKGDKGDWEHGWMKHVEKKRERKMRQEQERLTQNCGESVKAFCADMESVQATKQCLAMNYASLDSDCAEYLISSDNADDDGRKYHHIGRISTHTAAKLLFMIVGFTLLVALACACRRRCKRRRQMWREMMQRNLATRSQEPRYVAVPTQTVPVNAQVQQAQLVPIPTAPQQAPQPTVPQGVIYAASPYTGGIPVSAVPVAYNPQAMSIA